MRNENKKLHTVTWLFNNKYKACTIFLPVKLQAQLVLRNLVRLPAGCQCSKNGCQPMVAERHDEILIAFLATGQMASALSMSTMLHQIS